MEFKRKRGCDSDASVTELSYRMLTHHAFSFVFCAYSQQNRGVNLHEFTRDIRFIIVKRTLASWIYDLLSKIQKTNEAILLQLGTTDNVDFESNEL